MAVDDFLSRDTETLVLPSKSFYPLKIPIAHYQLRHFISSPEPDLLYYASGSDVYCLNVATKTQAHVTTLPWEARCTASGHGYVCVGGEHGGNFAAIKVAGFPPTDSSEVDALLPLDLPRRTSVPRPPLLGAAHRVRIDKIGQEIVNSISIHKLCDEADGPEEVVAVLTNNDQTVRLYSLTHNLEVGVLDLPFAMNHATISPDGRMLVAVGDQNVAFFFERAEEIKPASMIPPEWRLLEEVRLYVPPGSRTEGYFTTAWSPSGRLCAVGSECGYITVFDTELLRICEEGEDAIVQLLASSRPGTASGPGAVRTMQFSPSPWDLLIWSEDQAKVCVADVRSSLMVKQVLTLDPKEENLEKIEVADFDITLSPEVHALRREADFIRRYRRALDSEGAAAAVNYATGYIEAASERRRLHRQLGVVDSDDDPHGLTAQERQIIDALRTARQREEGRGQATAPRSVNYGNMSSTERRLRVAVAAEHFPSLRTEGRASERDTSSTAEATENRIFDFLADRALTESVRQRNVFRSLGTISNERGSSTETANNITGTPTTRSPGLIPAHARRDEREQVISSTDEAWRTIEEALARNARAAENVRNAPPADPRSERRIRQLTAMRERLRSVRESHPLDGSFSFGLPLSGSYPRTSRNPHDSEDGVRTAGLAMSQDGRVLYCGTEEGIFEFRINLHERKSFPAITPR